MSHGGDIYSNKVNIDFSVSLNPAKPDKEDDIALKNAFLAGIDDAGNYPDPDQREVRSAVAAAEGLAEDNILAGAGASELIMTLVRMICPKNVLLIEPGYSGYRYALSTAAGCKVMSHVLREEDAFTPGSDILDKITPKTDLLIIQDPINPTGKKLLK